MEGKRIWVKGKTEKTRMKFKKKEENLSLEKNLLYFLCEKQF